MHKNCTSINDCIYLSCHTILMNYKHIIQKKHFFFLCTHPNCGTSHEKPLRASLVARSFFEFKRQKNLNKNSIKKKKTADDDEKGARCTQARKNTYKNRKRRIEQSASLSLCCKHEWLQKRPQSTAVDNSNADPPLGAVVVRHLGGGTNKRRSWAW